MNRYLLILCFQLLIATGQAQSPNEASISIDLSQKTEKVSPLIFGQFIEYLGRCIDGGIYEEGSPLSGSNGIRKDVHEKVQGLNVPLLRFPGGTVVKIYHWQDGIGPKSERPKRKNLIWGGINDNHFGTAEFIEYCRAIGAEPFLVVNMSTGTPEEASNWVEYCNGTGDTYYANLRRSHGYDKPFSVKYWGIGNEEYAVTDAGKHQDVNRYIDDSWQFLKLMKLQDPSIKITLVGNSEDLNWSRKVVDSMQSVCDFLSVHLYSIPSDSKYITLLQSVENFNRSIESMRIIISRTPQKVQNFSSWYRFPPRQEPIKIAIDEWGIWDLNSGKGEGPYQMEYSYNWAHALAVGKFIQMFQRNADIIGLATWAQTVNVLAPIMTSKQGSYLQTIYTPLQAYRKYLQDKNLPVEVVSPTLGSALKMVDATASISEYNDEITLSVINLSENEQIPLTINFKNSGGKNQFQLEEQLAYSAPSLNASNTIDKNVVKEAKSSQQSKPNNQFVFKVQPATINFFVFRKH